MKKAFEIGQLVVTRGAFVKLDGQNMYEGICRHKRGDWGELCDEDKALNDEALQTGEGRLMSEYHDRWGTKYWIITEADRSVTTILLPEEY